MRVSLRVVGRRQVSLGRRVVVVPLVVWFVGGSFGLVLVDEFEMPEVSPMLIAYPPHPDVADPPRTNVMHAPTDPSSIQPQAGLGPADIRHRVDLEIERWPH